MPRKILIGLDGSDCTNAAISLGIRWARRCDAVLVGLGIVDEPTICRLEPMGIGSSHYKRERDQCLVARARRRVETLLEDFEQRCAIERVRSTVVEAVGLPSDEIVRESRLCDVIILGRSTYFQFETQDWPDETLREVLRKGSRPVVAVPELPREGSGIVVAYDGSPQADRALQAFQTSGLLGGEELHVVSIDVNAGVAQRLADQAVDFFKVHGDMATARPLKPVVAIHKLIIEQVEELRAGLLVMGAYGRSMWREFVFGSTTTSVLKASPVPLFLCH